MSEKIVQLNEEVIKGQLLELLFPPDDCKKVSFWGLNELAYDRHLLSEVHEDRKGN